MIVLTSSDYAFDIKITCAHLPIRPNGDSYGNVSTDKSNYSNTFALHGSGGGLFFHFFMLFRCAFRARNFQLSPDLINSELDKNNSADEIFNDCFLLGPITIKSLGDDRLLLPSPSSLLWRCRYDIKMNLDTLWWAPEQRTKVRAFELEYCMGVEIRTYFTETERWLFFHCSWSENRYESNERQTDGKYGNFKRNVTSEDNDGHAKNNHMNLFTHHLE